MEPRYLPESSNLGCCKTYPLIRLDKERRANNFRRANNELFVEKRTTQLRDIRKGEREILAASKEIDFFALLQRNTSMLRFESSGIHQWGVFSGCKFKTGDPLVEYTGELIRNSIAEIRQIQYEHEGNNGSYIFRIDDDTCIDATRKGGIARFLNHSCDPNCDTDIILINKIPHVIISAIRDIEPLEELTYDYRLPHESKKKAITCLCGSPKCKKYLNYSEDYAKTLNYSIEKVFTKNITKDIEEEEFNDSGESEESPFFDET